MRIITYPHKITKHLQKITLLGMVSILALIQCLGSVTPAQAMSLDDVQAIYNWPLYKLPSCTAGAGIGTGTLPAMIPDPYNSAFTKGANKHKVAPALIAGLFTEENFTHTATSQLAATWKAFPKRHPNPNSGWPTNQFHTMGAFQFIPGTWKAYGDDGDGDGKKDPQNIWDGAAAAAKYVAANGATVDKPPASWQKAIFAYNHAQWYVDAVMMYYNFYKNGGTGGASTVPPGVDASTPTDSSCGTAGAGTCAKVSSGASAAQIGANVAECAKNELALWTSKPPKMTIGFRLHNPDSYSKYVKNTRAEDWCGDFVSWIYNQVGYPLEGGWLPAVASFAPMGQRNNKFTYHSAGGYTPKVGDIAIHGPNHVNLVVAVQGSKVTYIGGNQRGGADMNTNIVSQVTTSAGVTGYDSPTGKW